MTTRWRCTDAMARALARLIKNDRGHDVVAFMDNPLRRWLPYRQGRGAWFGTFIENVVQGVARDLLACAMVRLEAANYKIVLHVHDELVAEMSDGIGDIAEFKRIIEELPEWAAGWPIAAKVRNVPPFSDVDTPVEHVAGSFDTVPRVKHGGGSDDDDPLPPVMVKLSGDIEPGPLVAKADLSSDDPRERFLGWILEREAIRLRRLRGQPWPYNQILRDNRFCNIRREDDYTTKELTAIVLPRYRGDPDLGFTFAVARLLNECDTVTEIAPFMSPFDAQRILATLEARAARGDKIFRGVYRSAMAAKGEKRVPTLIRNLQSMWEARETLRWQPDDTLATVAHRLCQCPGLGPFLAAQVIADIKHVAPWSTAADWATFALPGPGSERGLNRARGRPVGTPWPEAVWLRDLAKLHAEIKPLLDAAGIPPLDFQNMQNCLCEWDKHERACESDGKTNRPYKPVGQQETKAKTKPKPEAKPEILIDEVSQTAPKPADSTETWTEPVVSSADTTDKTTIAEPVETIETKADTPTDTTVGTRNIPATLLPDRAALAKFGALLFKRASPGGFISLRAFPDDARRTRAIFVEAVPLGAANLLDRVTERARQAAACPEAEN